MQNFTRGKWQYTIIPSKKKTLTGNDFLIFTGSPDPKENGIDIALAFREADARLIAAAPDLVAEWDCVLGYLYEFYNLATNIEYKRAVMEHICYIEELLACIY